MLTFGEDTVWGIRRHHLSKWKTPDGGRYILFAEGRPKPSEGEKHRRDFRKTRDENFPKFTWTSAMPIRPRAMIKAGGHLVLAGTTDQFDKHRPYAVYEGKKGGVLCLVSASDGQKVFQCRLDSPPVWDGLAAAGRRIYVSSIDGSVSCFGKSDVDR
jgi:hypothetical protein